MREIGNFSEFGIFMSKNECICIIFRRQAGKSLSKMSNLLFSNIDAGRKRCSFWLIAQSFEKNSPIEFLLPKLAKIVFIWRKFSKAYRKGCPKTPLKAQKGRLNCQAEIFTDGRTKNGFKHPFDSVKGWLLVEMHNFRIKSAV